MPVLRNPRHERMAQELAALKPSAEAGQLAGFDSTKSSFRSNMRKMAARPDIRARVLEIQQAESELAEVSAAWCVLQLKRRIEFNVDDYLGPPDAEGRRYFNIGQCSRAQLERLAELGLDEVTETMYEGREAVGTRFIRKTRLKPYSIEGMIGLIARIRGYLAPEKHEHALEGLGERLDAARARLIEG